MINSITLRLIKKIFHLSEDFVSSKLYDDRTFYSQLIQDLKNCKREVIIESPFITFQRTQSFIPVFEQLMKRNIKIYIMTRNPDDLDSIMRIQSEREIRKFEMMGVQVFLSGYFSHRKLAILDRKILWEGSLNILSHSYSREIMRRIESKSHAEECLEFIGLKQFLY